MTELNREVAAKVVEIVRGGLVKGLGVPVIGEMCVEAAVCLALGLPHGDDPGCVSDALRSLKITLNDKNWSSPAARAKGLLRLAVAQLGTKDELDDKAFVKAVAEMTIRKIVPIALRAAASITPNQTYRSRLEIAAIRCEEEGTKGAANAAAYAAAYAANAAANAAAYAANAAANAAAYAAYAADAAADAAANAADAAAKRDSVLAMFAEEVVQILIRFNGQAIAWLDLAPKE